MKPEAPDPSILVTLEHVEACIEQRTIVRDISLRLRHGEHMGIVGANGSGKTTLLRLIAGTHWPAPGRGRRSYFLAGRQHRDAVEARKRISLVGPELQDSYARLGWNFTASAVVVTGVHRTEIPRSAITKADLRTAKQMLALVDAAEVFDRPFFELSRGEQRRVLIARALAFRPDVLLLDEPGSGLDETARRNLDHAISQAARETTIVATAHTVDALPAAIERVVEIREGTIHQVDGKKPMRPGRRAPPVSIDRSQPQISNRPPIAAVSNANIWVGDQLVLRDINWQLEQNEHWLITGRNGAGKSTFLRLLNGQIRPARGGSISWPALGNPRNIWDLRRMIGWVSPELQADYRFPTTVEQCVASGFESSVGQTRRLNAQQAQQQDELLSAFELEDLRTRLLSRLSYGQARRALLARTLAGKPRLLLLDEPWEGLDPRVIDIVVTRLRSAMRHGTQILCASHIGDGGLGLTRMMRIADGTIREYEPA